MVPAWVRRLANHPTVVLVARGVVMALGLGFGAASAYVLSLDAKISAANAAQAIQNVEFETRFIRLTSAVQAVADQQADARQDRLIFQGDVRESLDKLIDGQSILNSTQAGQIEQLRAIEYRLSRIEQ